MSSTPDTRGPPSNVRGGPPYPPVNAGLGGTPNPIPDIPVSAVLLVLYLILGITHIKIFKANKNRGHKFVFNGALLGLCKIRIITMTLRMVWACYPRNTGLAIAANIFVYVGTIILYGVDWFFVQRIIRAQHTHFGWSKGYRIFHRAGLAILVASLLMLVISQIWQFFTRDTEKLSTFRDLFLVAQSYFTVFTVAPAIMVIISTLAPHNEVEKFGAGRMRNNIIILLLAVFILSIGQVYRLVLAYIPPTPLQPVQRGQRPLPVYLNKAFFFCLNFVTEILVIAMFAVVRVDLRFHVPNGSRKTGDYSSSRVYVDDEKQMPSVPHALRHHGSCSTLHRYDSSIFEDTSTLADSLRYPSSIIEMDEKTGAWKVKRMSRESSTRTSATFASTSKMSVHSRHISSDVPPLPELSTEWPLPDALPPHSSEPLLEHSNPVSRRATVKRGRAYEFDDHHLNSLNVGDAVTDALNKLEMNSEKNKVPAQPLPTRARSMRSAHANKSTPAIMSRSRAASVSASARRSQSHGRATSSNAPIIATPAMPKLTHIPDSPHALTTDNMRTSSPSYIERLEIIETLQRMSRESPRTPDTSPGSPSRKRASSVPATQSPTQQSSINCSNASSSSDAREAERAVEEFRRFSYEAPIRPLEFHSSANTSNNDLPNYNYSREYRDNRDELWLGR